MSAVWAGIDSGKRAHHCVVIDQDGQTLLSRRVENDETVLLELIAEVAEVGGGGEIVWATDLNSGGAALLISLLVDHGQQVLYIPGRIVHHAAATYRGEGKTDAKDARIIADQARMRTDLQAVHGGDQISVDLRLLTARRLDLIHDRVQRIRIHAAAAALTCPSLIEKTITPHVLRHTTAMRMLAAGIDVATISLCLGHESIDSTSAYLHADLSIKQRAMDRTAPPETTPGRYREPCPLAQGSGSRSPSVSPSQTSRMM